MDIESRVGKGTSILIHLPVDCEAAPDARSDRASDRAGELRDEVVVREVVRKRA
jgi:hypothetical protein